jgi:hypothetical protein
MSTERIEGIHRLLNAIRSGQADVTPVQDAENICDICNKGFACPEMYSEDKVEIRHLENGEVKRYIMPAACYIANIVMQHHYGVYRCGIKKK